MKPYIPDELPLKAINWRALTVPIGRANAALARYDGLLQGIPNPAIMLSPLTTQEAVLSSKIEGTQATLDEVLAQDAGIHKDGEKLVDIQEIGNYREALFLARGYLADYPIKLSFIRELHKVLMSSVRGQDKTPGEFRTDQNWIGIYGTPIEQATFVPPNPLQLPDFLRSWEEYLDLNDQEVLLQTAIVHAQFELLHPFKDGNGRIGRILIPLFLYQKQILSQPMFYLSEYLEAHRETYYQRLNAISAENDWDGWLMFFLEAVEVQANQNSARVSEIRNLYEQMKVNIHELTHSQYAVHVLDAIFSKPIFRTSDFVEKLQREFGMHPKTSRALLNQIKKADILQVLSERSGSRPAVLWFPELINLAEGR